VCFESGGCFLFEGHALLSFYDVGWGKGGDGQDALSITSLMLIPKTDQRFGKQGAFLCLRMHEAIESP
jgi:hypothetical protein